MRFTHSRITRAVITLVITGCIGGTGSGLMGVAGGNGGGAGSNTPPVLGFFTQPGSTGIGQALSPVQITTSDSLGGLDSTFTGTVTVRLGSNSTGAALGGTTAVRAINGIATFTNLTVDRAGNYTLVASASGSASVTSSAFLVRAATTP